MIFHSLQALSEEVAGLREGLGELTGFPVGGAPAWSVNRPVGATTETGPLEGSISVPLGVPMEEVELRLIEETLRRLGGDKRRTAEILGIGLRTLYRRLALLEERWRKNREPNEVDESYT
jgi:DNA-binding NtrC family response regulator